MKNPSEIPKAQGRDNSTAIAIWVDRGQEESLISLLRELQGTFFQGALIVGGFLDLSQKQQEGISELILTLNLDIHWVQNRVQVVSHSVGTLLADPEYRTSLVAELQEGETPLNFLQTLSEQYQQDLIGITLSDLPLLSVEEERGLSQQDGLILQTACLVLPVMASDPIGMAIRRVGATLRFILKKEKALNDQIILAKEREKQKERETEETIAHLQEAETKLVALSERLQMATESASIGVWEWDTRTGKLIWNPQMFQIFGMDREEFSGEYEDWRKTVVQEDLPAIEQTIQQSALRQEAFSSTFRITKNGETRYIRVVANSHYDPIDQSVRMVGINWDDSRNIIAEQNMIKAKDQAEELARLKSNFMANMSHEIRTPLNGILGLAFLAREEENLEDIHQYIQDIEFSGKRLLHILTGILELAILEAEAKQFNFREINLGKVLADCVKYWQPSAKSKGINLPSLYTRTQYYIWGDENMLNMILENIVGNAVKFTDSGSISTRLEIVDKPEKASYVNVIVADTGIGISPEKFEEIFEAFSQLSRGHARSHEGGGIGLAVAKRYVNLLGGTIQVKSEKGKGAEFIIRLPLRKVVH